MIDFIGFFSSFNMQTSARNRNGSDNESSKKPTKRRQNGTARMNRRVSKSTSLNFHPIIGNNV